MQVQRFTQKLRTGVAIAMIGTASVFFSHHLSGCSGGNGSRYEQVQKDTVYVLRSELSRQMYLKGDEINDAARLKDKLGFSAGWKLRNMWWHFSNALWQNVRQVSGDTNMVVMEDVRNSYMRKAGIEAIDDLTGTGDAAFVWSRGKAAIEDASVGVRSRKQIR